MSYDDDKAECKFEEGQLLDCKIGTYRSRYGRQSQTIYLSRIGDKDFSAVINFWPNPNDRDKITKRVNLIVPINKPGPIVNMPATEKVHVCMHYPELYNKIYKQEICADIDSEILEKLSEKQRLEAEKQRLEASLNKLATGIKKFESHKM